MSSRTQRNQHSEPQSLVPALLAEQHSLDALLTRNPIPGPKPWSDELERAAISGCAYATPPQVSLRALGIPSQTASAWLSDEPPEAYRSACFALAGRLKEASSWCERSLLARIAKAGEDPRYWTASAWILERSKSFSQQYIAVADQSALGPSTVVNIGQLIVNQAAGPDVPRVTWRDDPRVIEAQSEGESVPTQANPSVIPND